MAARFASNFGWHPSDRFTTAESQIACDHLLIEHGLENAAVISFLNGKFSNLSFIEVNELLNISYNNMVDWHIAIEPEAVTFLYNRTNPVTVIAKLEISRTNLEAVRYEAFERIVGKKPNPNIPSLDNAFIETISFWKRNLSAEVGPLVSNESFSTLFNSLIFLRAVEDTLRREGKLANESITNFLLDSIQKESEITPHDLIEKCFRLLTGESVPSFLIDLSKICVFDAIGKNIFRNVIKDFYRNRFAPYEYDFSLMSKHALSRIYEHYVSILRVLETEQLTLFPQLPEEEKVKAYGGVYTPQFIAKFFAKFIKKEIPLQNFRNLKFVDPACGSGIFLRTILEMQLEPDEFTDEEILNDISFDNVSGVDVDVNACNAAKLSLSLLHLVSKGKLPQRLDIIAAEAISYYTERQDLNGSYDIVVANPPFISLDTQSPEIRERLVNCLGELAKGRVDVSLAFIKIAIDLLKPGGFGLFVLPHGFLLGSSSASVRKLLYDCTWIRALADLSAIKIFENAGAYVVLLVFQKKIPVTLPPNAKIVKCRDLVGKALEDALKNIPIETKYYSIYETDQTCFQGKDWTLLPPAEESFKRKLAGLPRLNDLFVIRQGFISGADDIFTIKKDDIPKGEHKLFVPYLHDREMRHYQTPKTTEKYLFYPYHDGKKLDKTFIEEKYPNTWRYLESKSLKLSSRKSLTRYNKEWWEPLWPRLPENMMRPKIVTPHLVLFPKFSVDFEGKFAVSHSPLLYLKEGVDEVNTLKIYAAILNSSICNWYISSHSHKYQRGYLVLEPSTLASVPIPMPSDIALSIRIKLVNLVDRRLSGISEVVGIDKEIDSLVTEIYGLNSMDLEELGFNL